MLYSAFILGLISSLHCIGMCGPIAMMLPVDHQNEAKKATQIITYHLGRLTAYATIGLNFWIIRKRFFSGRTTTENVYFYWCGDDSGVLIPEKVFSKYNFSKPVYKIISK